jgi:hypothetical protein
LFALSTSSQQANNISHSSREYVERTSKEEFTGISRDLGSEHNLGGEREWPELYGLGLRRRLTIEKE